jgi:hypothetical protein
MQLPFGSPSERRIEVANLELDAFAAVLYCTAGFQQMPSANLPGATMRIIAALMPLLLAAGCVTPAGSNANLKSLQTEPIDETAVKNGTDAKLRFGMPIDDAIAHLEASGFKPEKTTSSTAPDSSKSDERPAFLYRKIDWGTLAFPHRHDTLVWLYYQEGKLIDIRVCGRTASP